MNKREKAKDRALQKLKDKPSFSEQLSQNQLDFLCNYNGPIAIGPNDKRFIRKETDMSERDVWKDTPPGSQAAIKAGCTCPVMDNGHGRGYMGNPEAFVINGDCPLHVGGQITPQKEET